MPLESSVGAVSGLGFVGLVKEVLRTRSFECKLNVVRSLEAALWAFYRGETFREGCLLAANLGNDADTTAAICGQSAGAHYGVRGIPAVWTEQLAMKELLRQFALGLHAMAEAQIRPA